MSRLLAAVFVLGFLASGFAVAQTVPESFFPPLTVPMTGSAADLGNAVAFEFVVYDNGDIVAEPLLFVRLGLTGDFTFLSGVSWNFDGSVWTGSLYVPVPCSALAGATLDFRTYLIADIGRSGGIVILPC